MGRITGFDIAAEINRVANEAVIPAMDETTEAMVQVAKGATPVRTGHLRDSWSATPAKRTGEAHVHGSIQNDAEYAIFVDAGTSRMAGRHMSAQAIDSEAPNLPGRIRSRL